MKHETDQLVLVVHPADDANHAIEVWARTSNQQLCLTKVNLIDAAARQQVASQLPVDMQADFLAGAMALATDMARRSSGTAGIVDFPDLSELTDAGNARRFAGLNAGRLRYSHAQKLWYQWDGRRWAAERTGEASRAVKDFVRSEKAAACAAVALAESGSEAVRRAKAWQDHAIRSESRRGLDAIEKLARDEAELVIDAAKFDGDPWLLNCQNGTVDLRTGALLGHSASDLISRIVPIPYDSAAQCPRWERFLLEVMGHQAELVDYLQRAVGWTLTGDISEQAMLFLYGLGANGKSTFMSVLRALLGEYAMDADPSTFLDRTQNGVRDDLARLPGARLVSCAETGSGERLSEALIKQITGGEPITARPLYGKHITFQPTFKLTLLPKGDSSKRE